MPSPWKKTPPEYQEVNGAVVHLPKMRCPLCKAECIEFIDSAFQFSCGTVYASSGGLSALQISDECLERRKSSGYRSLTEPTLVGSLQRGWRSSKNG